MAGASNGYKLADQVIYGEDLLCFLGTLQATVDKLDACLQGGLEGGLEGVRLILDMVMKKFNVLVNNHAEGRVLGIFCKQGSSRERHAPNNSNCSEIAALNRRVGVPVGDQSDDGAVAKLVRMIRPPGAPTPEQSSPAGGDARAELVGDERTVFAVFAKLGWLLTLVLYHHLAGMFMKAEAEQARTEGPAAPPFDIDCMRADALRLGTRLMEPGRPQAHQLLGLALHVFHAVTDGASSCPELQLDRDAEFQASLGDLATRANGLAIPCYAGVPLEHIFTVAGEPTLGPPGARQPPPPPAPAGGATRCTDPSAAFALAPPVIYYFCNTDFGGSAPVPAADDAGGGWAELPALSSLDRLAVLAYGVSKNVVATALSRLKDAHYDPFGAHCVLRSMFHMLAFYGPGARSMAMTTETLLNRVGKDVEWGSQVTDQAKLRVADAFLPEEGDADIAAVRGRVSALQHALRDRAEGLVALAAEASLATTRALYTAATQSGGDAELDAVATHLAHLVRTREGPTTDVGQWLGGTLPADALPVTFTVVVDLLRGLGLDLDLKWVMVRHDDNDAAGGDPDLAWLRAALRLVKAAYGGPPEEGALSEYARWWATIDQAHKFVEKLRDSPTGRKVEQLLLARAPVASDASGERLAEFYAEAERGLGQFLAVQDMAVTAASQHGDAKKWYDDGGTVPVPAIAVGHLFGFFRLRNVLPAGRVQDLVSAPHRWETLGAAGAGAAGALAGEAGPSTSGS